MRAKGEEIDQLRLDGEVPTEDALAAARGDRDAAWGRLKEAWDGRLAAPYERAVRDADEAADRLRREARRVGDHARLLADRDRLGAALDDLRDRHAWSLTRLDAIQARWVALWQPLRIDEPGTPREMRAWSRRVADLAALAGTVREKAEAVLRREAQVSQHRRELADALAPLGEPAPDPEIPLADLLERAQDVVDAVARETKARERLKDDLDTLKAERPARQDAAAASQAAWDRWQGLWADAMTRIKLAPGALPSEANAVLSLTADLFDRTEKAEDHRRRVEAITRDAGRFASDVWTLAERVAPDLAVGKFDAEAAAAELADRLTRAQ
ncbi:MAG: hypothetical protein LC745_12240, partial [Planctomycetia bacterium]|nr:hypothetical protein [Planctomycetia bacterium]